MYADLPSQPRKLDACGDRFGVEGALHQITRSCSRTRTWTPSTSTRPMPITPRRAIAALKAGKHVASTVPAATTVDECRQIVEAQRESGKVYMMMETVVYSREYLFVKELHDKGELGRIQFLRGSHQQDMDGWPGLLGRVSADAVRHALRQPVPGAHGQARRDVVCHGSGRIDEDADSKVRQPLRHRNGDIQDARLGCLSPK